MHIYSIKISRVYISLAAKQIPFIIRQKPPSDTPRPPIHGWTFQFTIEPIGVFVHFVHLPNRFAWGSRSTFPITGFPFFASFRSIRSGSYTHTHTAHGAPFRNPIYYFDLILIFCHESEKCQCRCRCHQYLAWRWRWMAWHASMYQIASNMIVNI